MKKISFFVLSVLGISLLMFNIGHNVYAVDAKTQVCKGINQAVGATGSCDDESGVNTLVSTIINILSWLLGIVAVIMIIIGSLKYVTSGGDSGKVASAKNTIIYALVGIVLVALSRALIRFVLHRTAG